jgi:hypothetical protein
MNLRTGTALALLTLLLGLVACGTQEEGADVATFEEAPCPFGLPASIVQGQDILCGYVTVPEVHAQPDGETIRLEPFTDAAYGIRGLLPAGWVNAGPGTFVRLNSKGELAFLLMARLPKLPLDQHLTPRLQRLGVSELPERGGRPIAYNSLYKWARPPGLAHLSCPGTRLRAASPSASRWQRKRCIRRGARRKIATGVDRPALRVYNGLARTDDA